MMRHERKTSFKLYLNPGYEEDRAIHAWLLAIPNRKRSGKIREALLSVLKDNPPPDHFLISFQFRLNPKRETDRQILLWLSGVPKRMRSQRMKGLLLKVIQPIPSPRKSNPPQPGIGQAARRVIGSIFKPDLE
ncbi:hypothetical protein [Candidatus Manganitrophus noduliformans]|uniref:Uncharacterized protein n=1 Tax=Candidatus Manganitrophus noduliformans TaxID=2606439 RepID=A0A7X6DT59_9BACT|nr:hypothetical protein [Candidatus Manganitrophus noduliformans]NKE72855.1 hypothetical protein [Candidatus Manganitrophus noduliformans]